MLLTPGETSLVITGAWNPAILNPGWIAKNVFELPEGDEINVLVDIPVQMGISAPRIKIRDFTYIAERTRLILVPESSELAKLNDLENIARKLLVLLSHTPVNGLGFNFEFVEAHPAEESLEAFNQIGNDLVVASAEAVTVIERDTAVVLTRALGQVTVKTALAQNQIKVNLNFHYPLSSASGIQAIPVGRFAQDLEYARALMAHVYDFEEEALLDG